MKNRMFSLIASDMRAKAKWVYGDISNKTVLKAFLTDGSAAMLWYRFMQASQRLGLKPLAMMFNKINSVFCSCVIGRDALFGEGFVLIHSNGVVINSKVIGGKNILIEHGVTIGEEKGAAPVGANAVVVKDVPEGTTAVGVPAKNIL